jgi:hypothetical protein
MVAPLIRYPDTTVLSLAADWISRRGHVNNNNNNIIIIIIIIIDVLTQQP